MYRSDSDLIFEPGVSQWHDRVAQVGARKVLLIGVSAEQTALLTLRQARVPSLGIPSGTYLFGIDGDWCALVVDGPEGDARAWDGRSDRCEDGEPAVRAWQWFQALWDSASPVGPKPRFESGSVVHVRGSEDVGTVIGSPTWSGDGYSYSVQVKAVRKTFLESSLEPFDVESQDPAAWVTEFPAPPGDVALRLSFLKMTKGLSDTIYSYGSTKTVFRSYQFMIRPGFDGGFSGWCSQAAGA
jgi:hypothetical protein